MVAVGVARSGASPVWPLFWLVPGRDGSMARPAGMGVTTCSYGNADDSAEAVGEGVGLGVGEAEVGIGEAEAEAGVGVGAGKVGAAVEETRGSVLGADTTRVDRVGPMPGRGRSAFGGLSAAPIRVSVIDGV